MRVVVTGASGTIGGALAQALHDRGDTVIGISRSPAGQAADGGIDWRSWDDLAAAIAGSDAVVHLAGAGVADKRWSGARKREMRESRIDTARRIVAAIQAAGDKPAVFVSGSAVGIYGSRGDELLTEESASGDDFLAQLCVDWEAAAQGAGVRTVILRTGVVLAREGGALAKLLLPFKLGAGGPIGRGRQQMAWIHGDDIVGLILHAIDTPGLEGALNGVAPEPVTNAVFSKALGAALRRPALMPTPPLALRLLLGERAGVLTASQRVSADRALQAGYTFRHPEIGGALRDLVG
ncbi:MAG: TIGR01777 family protein [Chloroflexi bacterium]|nr:TIGR01777 family protein [Chloroflexota bacterium]